VSDAITAGTVTVATRSGVEIEAYAAHPVDTPAAGGVVVIHDWPGFDQANIEISRRFATWGYAAACPNLHSFITADDAVLDGIAGAITYLNAVPGGPARVATFGHGYGGRHSMLAACELDVAAAVNLNGVPVLADPPIWNPMPLAPLRDRIRHLHAPLLGLFDTDEPSAEVDELDRLLTELGKEHEFHRVPGRTAVARLSGGGLQPSGGSLAAGERGHHIRTFLARHLHGHLESGREHT
jgi:carboxymethylenebutenolidase